MADSWKPPVAGTPCWIKIPATNVARAEAFYSKIFNWTFSPVSGTAAEEMRIFGFPDPGLSIAGSIHRVDKDKHVTGTDAVTLYLIVDDLEETMTDIVKNGGVKRRDAEPEGDHGFIMHADDTEGNHFGIYMMKKPGN